MSELLKNLATFIRSSSDIDFHVVNSQNLTDETSMLPPSPPTLGEAKLVEPCGKIDGINVGVPVQSHFTCFLDGIERRHLPISPYYIPILYAHYAAAIRRRGSDKKMGKLKYTPKEALFYPVDLIEKFKFPNSIKVVDVKVEKPEEAHPMLILDMARNKIHNMRNSLEHDLASEWMSEYNGSDEWLVVDGMIGGNFSKYECPNIIGISKSHQTQFFRADDQRKILSLKPGERSGIFIPKIINREEVYSWYLRLWPNDGRDVYFGLIRVEAPAKKRILDMADEISRWLLAERTPLSLPDSRWDKMIYPIRDCELYLKSLAPTKIRLDAALRI